MTDLRIASTPADLEPLEDDRLDIVVGGDNPGHGNYGGSVQCVERLNADGSFTQICSVAP